MDEKTLAALNKSIDGKWKGIRYRGAIDYGTNGCELCARFSMFYCDGCPVYEKTGRAGCFSTPYYAWQTHQRQAHQYPFSVHPGCQQCIGLCDAEIAFLESLLPDPPTDQAVAPSADKAVASALTTP